MTWDSLLPQESLFLGFLTRGLQLQDVALSGWTAVEEAACPDLSQSYGTSSWSSFHGCSPVRSKEWFSALLPLGAAWRGSRHGKGRERLGAMTSERWTFSLGASSCQVRSSFLCTIQDAFTTWEALSRPRAIPCRVDRDSAPVWVRCLQTANTDWWPKTTQLTV